MLPAIYLLTTGFFVSSVRLLLLFAGLYAGFVLMMTSMAASVAPALQYSSVLLGVISFAAALGYYWLLLLLRDGVFLWYLVWIGGMVLVVMVPGLALYVG